MSHLGVEVSSLRRAVFEGGAVGALRPEGERYTPCLPHATRVAVTPCIPRHGCRGIHLETLFSPSSFLYGAITARTCIGSV